MPYATQAELTDRYGAQRLIDLTDRVEPPAGTIDATVVDRALADTDALIDGYVGARYDLPLASVPALLRDLALAIAFHKLHLDMTPEKVAEDHREALRTLDRISKGSVKLDIAGAEPAGAVIGQPAHSAPDRVFTSDTLKDFTG